MKQLALDIGLAAGPSLANYFAGPNQPALNHLSLWLGKPSSLAQRSPVPTYLWGPTGSGKTHLLRAVLASLADEGKAAGWLDAAMPEPEAFDERWGAVFLDDVHLYTAVQQQAAFNWFINAQSHQLAVFAAGKLPPADLRLREDLRSRLGWGHTFALQVLSEPDRRAVLRQQADARGVFLSDELMDYLLSRFSRDLGNLMQILEQLDAYALRTQRAITIPLLKAMLDET